MVDSNFTIQDLYGSKILALGISSVKIYESKMILYWAFWQEFFDKIKMKIATTLKNSVIKLLNINLIYEYCEMPKLDSILRLIELSDTLKAFSKSNSISDYIRRMKSDDLCYPAIFELLFAKKIKDKWYEVQLQVLNNLWNPVEISFIDKQWVTYWVECKTSKSRSVNEWFWDKVLRKLHPLLQSLSNSIAINILLDDNVDYADRVDDIVKAISSNIHTNKSYLERLDRNISMKFPFGEISYLLLNQQTTAEVQQYFHKNSTQHVAAQIINRKDLSTSIASDPLDSLKRLDWILWVKYQKDVSIKSLWSKEKLLIDIKDKISQQKNLLETDCQVVIVLDKKSYIPFDRNDIDLIAFIHYKNLSIILADYEADQSNWVIKKTYIFLMKSVGFDENIIWDL